MWPDMRSIAQCRFDGYRARLVCAICMNLSTREYTAVVDVSAGQGLGRLEHRQFRGSHSAAVPSWGSVLQAAPLLPAALADEHSLDAVALAMV